MEGEIKMLRIVYVCKQNNTFDSEQFIKDKTYEEVLKIAKEYNDDLDNDYYISLVTNYTSEPTHTTGFLDPRYTMGFLSS